jgi:hypothetical protein
LESLLNSSGDRNLRIELIDLITKRAAGGNVTGSLSEADPLRFTYADMEVKAYLRDHYDGVMVRFGGTRLLVLETAPTVVRGTKENLRIILENGCRYPLVTVGISGGEIFDNLLYRLEIFSTMLALRVNEAQLDLALRSMTQQYHHLPLELGQPELDRVVAETRSESEKPEKAPAVHVATIDETLLADSLRKIDELVGLHEIKDQIRRLVATARFRRAQQTEGLVVPDFSPHMVFRGNPGTCKTTLALLIGNVYKALGLLKKGDVNVVGRGNLVAKYSGQTAPLTKAACDRARESILFIDEAYSLSADRDGFGLEAIQTLLVEMENNRGQLVVIVAGYPDEMDDFLEANPGLRSRFDLTVDFPDYSAAELVDIVISMSRSQSLKFTDEARSLLAAYIAEIGRGRHFGNGRDARKWLDAIVQEQARIWTESGGNESAALRVISAAAVEAGLKRFPRRKQDRPIGFIGGL